jgi:uncharacterized protein
VSERDPASPCIAICVLDPATDFCRGCHRTLDEIAGWMGASAEEKRRVLDRVAARRDGTAGSEKLDPRAGESGAK